MTHIHHLRRDYLLQSLRRKDLDPSPFSQFIFWLDAAIRAEVIEPNAMALATASKNGIPSCRMVLMKNFNENGLTFFTNKESRKGRELRENPRASAVFFWEKQERQVIIEGEVNAVDREETEKYFASRPRGSQLGSSASRQDTPIQSRETLEASYNSLEKQFFGKEVPCPDFWTGFCIIPVRFEFWQGRPDRLHDRFCYTLIDGLWNLERLSP